MSKSELTDAQWCFLDLLMRAKQRGIGALNRKEILYNNALPQQVACKLVFGGLLMMAEDIVTEGVQGISITPKGEALYKLKFGGSGTTEMADQTILLPDNSVAAN